MIAVITICACIFYGFLLLLWFELPIAVDPENRRDPK